MKKYFFRSHKKSTALIVSIGVHAALIAIAFSAIVITVKHKPEHDGFIETVETKKPRSLPLTRIRQHTPPPRMKPPQSLNNLVANAKPAEVTFTMPEIRGIQGKQTFNTEVSQLGDLISRITPYGEKWTEGKNYGNALVGTFYDLKQTADRSPVQMTVPKYISTIRSFVSRGWKEHILEDFFTVPTRKYTSSLMIPHMDAASAPRAFEVEDQVKPSFWVIHYKGKFQAPETGKYRFCGAADNVLIVRVGKKVVLDGSLPLSGGEFETNGIISNGWKSDDPNSGKFPLAQSPMMFGDWITLKAGTELPIEVLIGEIPGGHFSCQLLIQKEGEDYRTVVSEAGSVRGAGFGWTGGERPVLPIFKLSDISEDLREQMKINPAEATLTGPTFGIQVDE